MTDEIREAAARIAAKAPLPSVSVARQVATILTAHQRDKDRGYDPAALSRPSNVRGNERARATA